jgi:SAM-dependent methyltransferase
MSRGTDADFLRCSQYREPGNLEARISLHDHYSTAPEPYHHWLFSFLALPPDADILELGCGTGAFWANNAACVPPGWNLTLTDISPGMVATAEAALAELPNAKRFEVLDAQHIEYPDASFDAVVAHHMLYHVADRRTTFTQIQRVLRPGGKLYAATNGSAHLREIRDLERHFGLDTVFAGTHSAQAFGLQNGADQLEPYFHHIVCHRHDDALVVPDAEPLVAHVRSKLVDPDADAEKLLSLHIYLQHQIALEGSLRITKASGLFVATRRD